MPLTGLRKAGQAGKAVGSILATQDLPILIGYIFSERLRDGGDFFRSLLS